MLVWNWSAIIAHLCCKYPWIQFSWRYSLKLNCKRLPSHTGQEQACTRITQLFVRLFVCHHAKNGPIHRTMVVDCPLVITFKVKLIFRPDKTRKKEWMVQPVFCIVDAGSCLPSCETPEMQVSSTLTAVGKDQLPTRSMQKIGKLFNWKHMATQ